MKGALGTLLPLAAGVGCCPCREPEGPWGNAVRTDGVTPLRRPAPDSAAELVEIIRAAEQRGERVRMTGSGHSFSDVAITSDNLLAPSCLNRMLELDESRLVRGATQAELVRVQSGITIRELNEQLDRRGLALENLGGYDAQTIVGAATTGTHGSGLRHGPIAAQIVSLQLVTTGGRILQLEPSQGITDRARFPGRLEENDDLPVELVQNDDLFNAATVSLGCMGVVYSVVLRVSKKYWLREIRRLTTWSELTRSDGFLDRLLHGRKLRDVGSDPEHYEIYVNPYPHGGAGGKPEYRCLFTERFRLDAEPPLTKDDAQRGMYGGNVYTALAVLADDAKLLEWYMNQITDDGVRQMHDVALQTLADESYKALSYRVFNLGLPNLIRAWGIEMAFDLSQTITATQRLIELAEVQRRLGRRHSSPVALRFVAPAAAHLAMQHGRSTCMMEIGMLVGARGSRELLVDYERAYIDEFRARPHWGLDLNVLRSEAEVAALYPAYPKWKAAFTQLNTRGTFDGKFSDRLGISRRARP